MRGTRRFSEAIAEGDGISVLVAVSDPDDARRAAEEGAEGIVLRAREPFEPVGIPVLWCGAGTAAEAQEAGAHAFVLDVAGLTDEDGRLEELHEQARALGLDCVLAVATAEEIEIALERVDPEILLLRPRDRDPDDLDRVLELLEDVPAGKLAVAEVDHVSRDEVLELERAGMGAVIVPPGNVGELVGAPPSGF
jgi:indole-3-glycerol phosphate synthase